MGAIKYLLALLLILIPATSFADTHNAASCSSADVASAITASATGDIVTIPPGDCSGTPWTTGVTIPSGKNITIQGAGYTNTIIGHGSANVFNLGSTSSRVTGIQFKRMPANVGTNAGVVRANGSGWRVDHNFFNNNDSTVNTSGHEYVAVINSFPETLITGLIDNNIIYGRIDLAGHAFARAGTEWAAESRLGSENAVYIEDNVFRRIDLEHGNIIDASKGISYVARYNTVGTSSIGGHAQIMAHGLVQDNYRGTKNWEIYGNLMYSDSNVWMPAMSIRGGTGLVFSNNANLHGYARDNTTEGVTFYEQRAGASAYCSPTNSYCAHIGFCDGTGGTIDVDGSASNGYICRDQLGAGRDSSAWTTHDSAPSSAPTLSPAYVFNNYWTGTSNKINVLVSTEDAEWIESNREYYKDAASFNGTSGVGCGTLATLQGAAYYTSCTAGVGYWATDQSCSDITSFVGASTDVTGGERTKTSVISGTLYKCNATGDGWDSYYTPSAYPHTLRDDAGTDETAPTLVSATIAANGTSLSLVFSEAITVNTNTGFVLTADGSPTLTYASGTGTTTLVYTISAAVAQSESGITLAYTTGANYIEDAADNDLGSFTGTAVTNNSTQNTPPTVELTVTKTGSGCTVTSAPTGVNCGSTCTVSVDSGTVVTLSGWSENGWNAPTYGGDCASNGTVTMNAAKECTATCTQVYLFP